MAGKENTRRRRLGRRIRRALLLVLIALLTVCGGRQIRPLLAQGQTVLYEPFEVTQGTVRTSMSMSGTISVGAEETITNQSSTSFTEMVTVREIFVEESQRVSEGDKLLQLSNGDIYRAGIDGTVNQINVARGDWVRPNSSMMQICDIDNLIVTISVDEFDINQVSVGQACTITVLPLEISFDTQIGHINRISNAAGWVASYTVTADANAPESVWPGMQATVTIPQEEAVDVPVLPMAALTFDADGVPYVLEEDGEGYVRRDIETGLSDGMYVEIRSGLSVGDTVWAATGVEETEAALSLSGLYKKLVGEKVVIVDRSTSGRTGHGAWSGETPEEFALPADMTLPDGVPEDDETEADSPEESGGGSPYGAKGPAGMTRPDRTEGAQPEDSDDGHGGADGTQARTGGGDA